MSRYSVDISANLHGFEKLDAVESQIKQLNGSKIKIDIDLTSAQTVLKNFQNQLKNSKFTISPIIGNTGQYKQAGQQIGQLISSEAEKAIKNVTSKEIKVPFSVDISKSSKFQSEMENLVKKWTNGKGQLTNVNVQTKTAYDETSAQNIEKLNKATLTYKNSLNEVVQKTVEWKQIGTTIDANGNTKALMGFVESGSRYSKSMDNASKSTQTLISDIRRLSLANSIEKWNQKNTAATKECIATNEEYIRSLRDLDNVMSQEQYNKINLGFKQNETSMRGLGRLGASLRQQFSDAANSFGQWMSVSTSVMTLIYQIQKIPKEVYAVDTAMTNLYKVTNETQSRYDSFLDNAGKKAQDLGTTMSDLINQTADWTKLGYSLDESEILSNLSSIYQNVGEVDSSTAVSDMVTAMKAFNIEASNAVTIIDQLNALGNNFATSSADLGTGLTNSASAMATAGDDIQHTLAMLTGGAEITQNAGEFGNFLKVSSMRLRGMKGELEELGEDVDDSVDSISKVQTQILNLTHGAVNIFDDNGQFKSYYENMEAVSKVIDKLSSTEQASLMEILFGKQRGNQGAALIQAFQSGQVQKAYETAINSADSAQQEQDRWMDSLDAKLKQIHASYQNLSKDILDSNLAKGVVDTGRTAINVIDQIVKGLNSIGMTLPTIIGMVGGGFLQKNGLGKLIVVKNAPFYKIA